MHDNTIFKGGNFHPSVGMQEVCHGMNDSSTENGDPVTVQTLRLT